MKYKLSRSVGVDAQTVGSELERISEEHGGISPRVVVDEARPDDAPLHPAFEWRDEVAAESYRVWQARTLIRAVHVVEEDGAESHAFVNVSVCDDERAYHPIAAVVANPDMFAAAVTAARTRVESLTGALNDLLSRADDAKKKRRITRAIKAADKVQQEIGAL